MAVSAARPFFCVNLLSHAFFFPQSTRLRPAGPAALRRRKPLVVMFHFACLLVCTLLARWLRERFFFTSLQPCIVCVCHLYYLRFLSAFRSLIKFILPLFCQSQNSLYSLHVLFWSWSWSMVYGLWSMVRRMVWRMVVSFQYRISSRP